MKIGILTQPLINNYGGLMQAYALQKLLRDLGHDVQTINICYDNSGYRTIKGILGRLFRKYFLRKEIKSVVLDEPNAIEKEIISVHTKEFILENICITDPLKIPLQIKRLRSLKYDAYIVGSDQVWRPGYSPHLPTFFLEFLKDNKTAKRLAFAASFGVDYWEYNPILTKKCQQLVKKFDAISVREKSGVDLCQQYLDVEAKHILDPTLMLDKEQYIDLIGKHDTNTLKIQSTLMQYVLDETSEKLAIVERIKKHYRLKENRVMPQQIFSKKKRKNIDLCVYPPVYSWLKGFNDADFIVTDSFHGTVFSIIFRKPFITIGNRERGLSRFLSLLELFNLQSRLITTKEELTDDLLMADIDYSTASQILDEQRKKAYDFLDAALL